MSIYLISASIFFSENVLQWVEAFHLTFLSHRYLHLPVPPLRFSRNEADRCDLTSERERKRKKCGIESDIEYPRKIPTNARFSHDFMIFFRNRKSVE